jgi:hypothetical protein
MSDGKSKHCDHCDPKRCGKYPMPSRGDIHGTMHAQWTGGHCPACAVAKLITEALREEQLNLQWASDELAKAQQWQRSLITSLRSITYGMAADIAEKIRGEA